MGKKKEEKGKAEEVAEKTGVVGKGVKKGWGITKSIGKGLVKARATSFCFTNHFTFSSPFNQYFIGTVIRGIIRWNLYAGGW